MPVHDETDTDASSTPSQGHIIRPDALVRREKRHRRFVQDSIPFIEELRASGTNAASLIDLVNGPLLLSKTGVHIAIKHLTLTRNEDVQEFIVRAIAGSKCRYDGVVLARLFDSAHSSSLKWAIGNTIECTRPVGIEGWIVKALRNGRHGTSRQMLCVAAAKLLHGKAVDVLKEVFDEMPGHAAMGLGKCGGLDELGFLRSKAASARGCHTWVRNVVKKAIEQIEKRTTSERAKVERNIRVRRRCK